MPGEREGEWGKLITVGSIIQLSISKTIKASMPEYQGLLDKLC